MDWYSLLFAGIFCVKVKMAGWPEALPSLDDGLSSAFSAFVLGFLRFIPFPALWFNPTADPTKLLVISLILGGIQLYLGVILKAVARIKSRTGLGSSAGRRFGCFSCQSGSSAVI